MSLMPSPHRIDPFARFEVLFEPFGAGEPVVLRSAPDGEPATGAFYDERERLRTDHAAGQLLLVCHDEAARTRVRQPVG